MKNPRRVPGATLLDSTVWSNSAAFRKHPQPHGDDKTPTERVEPEPSLSHQSARFKGDDPGASVTQRDRSQEGDWTAWTIPNLMDCRASLTNNVPPSSGRGEGNIAAVTKRGWDAEWNTSASTWTFRFAL
jgi:hypothetical protein